MFTPDDEIRFVILPQVSPYCGPLFFYSRSPASAVGNVTASGSFGLVDTGTKKLLVTCAHVWYAFQQEQAEDSRLGMFVALGGNRSMVIETPPIDHDKALDLATFDMEPMLAACEIPKFLRLNPIPSQRLKKGQALFFLGYPGCLRYVSEEVVHFESVGYGVTFAGVDGRRFYSDISKGKPVRLKETKAPARAYQHRGISGSPCFAVRVDRPVQLVGFATSVWTNYLWFTDARCLNADGTINRTPA